MLSPFPPVPLRTHVRTHAGAELDTKLHTVKEGAAFAGSSLALGVGLYLAKLYMRREKDGKDSKGIE